jgi:hypothetical protein
MNNLLQNTIKDLNEIIEKQRVVYESLFNNATTDEQKIQLNKMKELSDTLDFAIKTMDTKKLYEILNNIKNGN